MAKSELKTYFDHRFCVSITRPVSSWHYPIDIMGTFQLLIGAVASGMSSNPNTIRKCASVNVHNCCAHLELRRESILVRAVDETTNSLRIKVLLFIIVISYSKFASGQNHGCQRLISLSFIGESLDSSGLLAYAKHFLCNPAI